MFVFWGWGWGGTLSKFEKLCVMTKINEAVVTVLFLKVFCRDTMPQSELESNLLKQFFISAT